MDWTLTQSSQYTEKRLVYQFPLFPVPACDKVQTFKTTIRLATSITTVE